MLRHLTLRNVAIAWIATFVVYAEYVVWIKSPMAQVTAICDNLRAWKEVTARNRELLRLIDEASAATLEPPRGSTWTLQGSFDRAATIIDTNLINSPSFHNLRAEARVIDAALARLRNAPQQHPANLLAFMAERAFLAAQGRRIETEAAPIRLASHASPHVALMF
jgi:hypothetical protein